MKYLLVLLVVLVGAWLLIGRRRGDRAPPPGPKPRTGKAGKNQPQEMLACAHCGVHLPQAEALMDAGGRPFCSEAHRLAGPR
jgi:uncharacterized protein